MRGQAVSIADPYRMNDNFNGFPWNTTAGLTPRNNPINTSIKNLVLLWAGQSHAASSLPTLYIPTNSTKIDQMNPYDGCLYPVTDKLLGPNASIGPGNTVVRLADKLITSGTADHIYIGGVGINGTLIEQWLPGGLFDRVYTVFKRFGARGIVPGLMNTLFVMHWMIGEDDALVGTTQSSYVNSFNVIKTALAAAGFSGRTFLTQETYRSGVTNATIRAAQAACANGVDVFLSADVDSLTGPTNRADTIGHLTDVGGDSLAGLIQTAMHASGAPL